MDNEKSINHVALASNIQTLGQARSAIAMVFGAAAGILGLTNTNGILFYLVASTVMSLALFLATKAKPERFLKQGSAIWTEGVVGGMFSYVLFWTLLYGMVHVYD